MSYVQSLDNIPVWVLFIITTLVFSIASELGFRVGKFIHERLKREHNPMVGTILGASLGLLAFFLAFTFSMAGSRYDTRKQLVLDEANAIERLIFEQNFFLNPIAQKFRNFYVNM